MTRYFKVAEHVFSLEMSDSNTLWQFLAQYEPFACEEYADTLFRLKFVKSIDTEGSTTVYDAPVEDGQLFIRIKVIGDGWIIEFAQSDKDPVNAVIKASKDFSEASLCILTHNVNSAVYCLNNALMLLYAFASAPYGTLEFHASVVSLRGRAYLFLGSSGTGKSTHSSLWIKNIEGTELVNDDNPVVRVWPDGRIIVYGSPWSGKTPCYRNVEFPVGAFVRIKQYPENRISRQSVIESYASLFPSVSGFRKIKEIADGLHYSLEKAVTTIPCYLMECLPDDEAALVCSRTAAQ